MSPTANTLLSQFGITAPAGFILVLARVSPLFAVAPMFSSKQIPARVRTIVAVALAIGLLPLALHGQHVPQDALTIAALALKELLVGLGFALSLGVLFAAINSAGALLDVLIGFSFGSLIDPLTGNQSAVLAQVYSLIAIAIFVVINGDAWVVQGLARTYDLVPLMGAPDFASIAEGVTSVFTTIFTSALEVCAPVLIAVVVTDVAFGVVSRVVPQLNVFAVGFPAKVVVGLLLVTATLPFVAGWIGNELQQDVSAALQAIRVA
jgi:flagellar biosynthesis protein FliR